MSIVRAQIGISEHPTFIKWKNIDTKNVNVIFPDGLEAQANRIANIINLITVKHSNSIGPKTKKVDLILQTNQVFSNGFATLAPIRSEFFGTPLQNNTALGVSDWLDLLSVHEYRHIQQFLNSRYGATKWMSYLRGQWGWGLAMNLNIPDWYSEGDATMTETVLSKNGRGRTPSFFSEQRALLLDNEIYSYHKARNGSFKDLVPSHYPLGYTIVNYSRNTFGTTIWKDVLADAGRYNTIFYPFSGALKSHTGFRAPELYKKSYAQLKQNWLTELDSIKLTKTQNITKQNKYTVTNYRNAHYLNDGSIVAIKSSYKETPYLVHLNKGKETKLTNIGIAPESFLSENNNRIAWTEVRTDIRWGNRNYTVIKLFDFDTKKKKTITGKGKFFSPQYSNNGDRIVTVENNEKLESSILILNSMTGKQNQKIKVESLDFVSFPKWTAGDKAIVYLLKRNSKLAFFKYELSNKEITQLSDWTTNTIGNYNINGSKIYFNAGYSGIDNIYSIDLDGSKKITQLTSVKVGAYTPDVSPNSTTLLFSELNKTGNYLSEIKIDKSINNPITPTPAIKMKRYNITLDKTENNILDSIPNITYEAEDYKGFLKGTKLHSWRIRNDNSLTSLNLQFDTVLSDFSAALDLGYNKNEESPTFGTTAYYSKYFPILFMSTDFQFRNIDKKIIQNNGSIKKEKNRFNEFFISGGVITPLNWVTGNYYTSLTPIVSYQYRTLIDFNRINNSSLSTMYTGFQFSNSRRFAFQNIKSRFSQSISFFYNKSITSDAAEKIYGLVSFNFPGLMKNHSLNIEGEYQKELLTNSFQFSDQFQYARGYYSFSGDQAQRISINYGLPLAYPDWGFAGITYFKRIRANLFCDITQIKNNFKFTSSTINANSYGAELLFDNTFLNFLPLSIGVRSSWKDINLSKSNAPKVEMFFGGTF